MKARSFWFLICVLFTTTSLAQGKPSDTLVTKRGFLITNGGEGFYFIEEGRQKDVGKLLNDTSNLAYRLEIFAASVNLNAVVKLCRPFIPDYYVCGTQTDLSRLKYVHIEISYVDKEKNLDQIWKKENLAVSALCFSPAKTAIKFHFKYRKPDYWVQALKLLK